MNKRIMELNISEENKILISKLEKRIETLSLKAQEHFDKSLSVSDDKIKAAYSNNEDLISILEQNDELASLIRHQASEIREQHQTNFTREQTLDISREVDDLSVINNTVDYKDNLVTADDKLNLLNKRIKFIKNKNTKRKEEYEKELDKIDIKMKKEEVLDINPMQEDVRLIKKLVDPKRLTSGRWWYLINIALLMLAVIIFIGAIWLI